MTHEKRELVKTLFIFSLFQIEKTEKTIWVLYKKAKKIKKTISCITQTKKNSSKILDSVCITEYLCQRLDFVCFWD